MARSARVESEVPEVLLGFGHVVVVAPMCWWTVLQVNPRRMSSAEMLRQMLCVVDWRPSAAALAEGPKVRSSTSVEQSLCKRNSLPRRSWRKSMSACGRVVGIRRQPPSGSLAQAASFRRTPHRRPTGRPPANRWSASRTGNGGPPHRPPSALRHPCHHPPPAHHLHASAPPHQPAPHPAARAANCAPPPPSPAT